MIAAILNFAILDSAILLKKKLHSFILTHLDDGSNLELCHVGFRHCHLGFRHLVIFSQIHTKTLSLHSESDSNQFNLINLMMAAILKCAILILANLHKTLTQTISIWHKLIHSHSTWWCQPSWILPSGIQPFWTKKNFTHSFWLNLMMAAILNSSMLDSDTAILDSDTLLSSLRFTQKHSHSTLTLPETNSI